MSSSRTKNKLRSIPPYSGVNFRPHTQVISITHPKTMSIDPCSNDKSFLFRTRKTSQFRSLAQRPSLHQSPHKNQGYFDHPHKKRVSCDLNNEFEAISIPTLKNNKLRYPHSAQISIQTLKRSFLRPYTRNKSVPTSSLK